MACGSCKTCAARCSNHPASYGHTPSRRPSPMISQKPSEPLHNLTLKPEPALADLHRIPDATPWAPIFTKSGWDLDVGAIAVVSIGVGLAIYLISERGRGARLRGATPTAETGRA